MSFYRQSSREYLYVNKEENYTKWLTLEEAVERCFNIENGNEDKLRAALCTGVPYEDEFIKVIKYKL